MISLSLGLFFLFSQLFFNQKQALKLNPKFKFSPLKAQKDLIFDSEFPNNLPLNSNLNEPEINKPVDSTLDLENSEIVGQNLLFRSIAMSDLDMIKFILQDEKTDLKAQDSIGNGPLHFAVVSKKDAILKLLLDTEKVDSNLKNQYGQTPLDLAILLRQTNMMGKLIQHVKN